MGTPYNLIRGGHSGGGGAPLRVDGGDWAKASFFWENEIFGQENTLDGGHGTWGHWGKGPGRGHLEEEIGAISRSMMLYNSIMRVSGYHLLNHPLQSLSRSAVTIA